MATLSSASSITQLHHDNAPFIILGGELHNSSAACASDLTEKFSRLAQLNLNTVLVPISWELIEPCEGQYDFSLVDAMLESARENNLFLVPLWFATLKNATSCYTPAWVKTDLQRFPRAETIPGKSSWTISPFGDDIQRCDARAFAALMKHIGEADSEVGTVLMMQVENEAGILGASRDRSALANAAFAEPVPAELTNYLTGHAESLHPVFANMWQSNGSRTEGSWQDVFGRDADEIFMAWHIARFVDHIAAAGRGEYDLPMFANAWLQKGPGYKAGDYPSGGPVARLLDVWMAAAPNLDFLAPDIYQDDFRSNCADYHRSDNPLFIPEARNNQRAPGNALYAIGRHQALGFAPFAIDDCRPDHPLGEVYRLLTDMMPVLVEAQSERRTAAVVQQEDEASWPIELDGIRFWSRTRGPLAENCLPGAMLLVSRGNSEFIAVGRNLITTFEPVTPQSESAELVYLDEGTFRDGKWYTTRRLNGDETEHGTAIAMKDRLCCYQFAVHCFC